MKNLFGVLRYVRGYWRYANLNIASNILSVVFNLFSLAMVIPFLNLLFLSKPGDYEALISKGVPTVGMSLSTMLDRLNYEIAGFVLVHHDQRAGKLQVLLYICIGVALMIFMKSLFRYAAMYFLAPIRNGVVKDLRNKIFKKVLDLPLSYYSGERKGDIMSRMTADAQEVEWSIMSSLEMIFREPVTIILFLIFLILLSPKLTIFVLIMLPVTALFIALIGKTLKRRAGAAKERLGVLLSIMEETLGGLRIIKAFNAEKKVKDLFERENNSLTMMMIRIYRRVDLASPLSEFLITSILMIVMFFGGRMVLYSAEELAPGTFIGFIAIFSQIITPARQLTSAFYNVQKGLASSERINKILDAEVTITDPENPKTLPAFDRMIEYRNVSFAYVRGDAGWALRNIDLKIQKGKTIALVGQSGSGKTTLADLLPRFYDPTEGEILIDGVPIRDVRLNDLRHLMGIVSQESILFNDTIFNNIAFGVEGATLEQVIAAAKVANAHEFIEVMPDAYNTNIGDRGGKLSGGQRQRIAIARAVLKNPPILILDEATSALDTESEKLVQDALNKLMQNRTSVIIAHRLSTIQHADEIIVLQKGVILERGTHQELLAKAGTYKKLYDLQIFV